MNWDVNSFLQQLRGGFETGRLKKEQEQKETEAAAKNLESNRQIVAKRLAEEGKTQQEIQKQVWGEEDHNLKVKSMELNLLEKMINLIGGEKMLNPLVKDVSGKETPSATPTPTPEKQMKVLGEAIKMLGLGTTWANNDTKPSYPDEFVPYANEAGSQYEIDPLILAAQDAQETGGYNYEPRVGSSGEQGIPQIIPKFHYKAAGVGDSNTYASRLANDPKYAIGEQARILSGYLKGQGNIYDALRQYNAGSVLENSGTYADEILKRAGLEKLIPGYGI